MKAKVMARSIQDGVYGCCAEAKQRDRTEKQVAVETKNGTLTIHSNSAGQTHERLS